MFEAELKTKEALKGNKKLKLNMMRKKNKTGEKMLAFHTYTPI